MLLAGLDLLGAAVKRRESKYLFVYMYYPYISFQSSWLCNINVNNQLNNSLLETYFQTSKEDDV